MTLSERIVGLVLLSLFMPFWLVSTFMLYKQRGVYNIKARGPILALIGQNILVGYLFATTATDLIAGLSSNDCGRLYFSLSLNFCVNLLPLLYGLRCWVLMFRYRISAVLSAYGSQRHLEVDNDQQQQIQASRRHSWYVHHRNWISSSVLLRAFVVGCVLSVCLPTILALTSDDCGYRANFLFAGFFVACWSFVIMLFSCYVNSEPRDVFGIKLELRQISMTILMTFVLLILGLIVLPSRLTFNCTILLSCLFIWIFGCVIPLYQAHQTWSEPDFVDLYEIKSLYDLLALDIGYKSFLDYCKREFAQENLLFWKDVHTFRAKYLIHDEQAFSSRDKCLREARVLFAQYIDLNSPFQVNLPGEILNDLREALQRELVARPAQNQALTTLIVAKIFDKALENVFALMKDDLLPRYIQSQEFMGFVQELKHNIDQTNDKPQPLTISSPTTAVSPSPGRRSLLGPPNLKRDSSPSPSQVSRAISRGRSPSVPVSPASAPPTPTSGSIPLDLLSPTGMAHLTLPANVPASSSLNSKYSPIFDGDGGTASAPNLLVRTATNSSNTSNSPSGGTSTSSIIAQPGKKSSNAGNSIIGTINPTHQPKLSTGSTSPSVLLDPTFGLSGSTSSLVALDRIVIVGHDGEKQVRIMDDESSDTSYN